MITIHIPENELYDEAKDEFYEVKEVTLELEHSLISVSKWESKWKKPYLVEEKKTTEEVLDYIRCMTINKNVDPNVYRAIPASEIKKIVDYINDPMTATVFYDASPMPTRNSEFITSELVYFWMTAYNIPFTCEKWNFNRLMTLIRIAGEKNSEQKKMSPDEIRAQNKMLNEKRRAALKSKG